MPRREQGAPLQLAFGDALGGSGDQFNFGDGCLSDAIDFAQAHFGCVDGFGEGAELFQ
jgi:hypothetical protein